MVLLYETYDLVKADMLTSELTKKGVLHYTNHDNLRGLRPSLGYVTPIKILVAEQDFELASQILTDIKRSIEG